MMNKTLLLDDLSKLFSIDVNKITDELILDPNGNWDSLNIISTVGAIDQYYNTNILGEELAACSQVGDIFRLIEAKH